MKIENNNIDTEQLVKDYQNGKGIYDICEIYHIGKIKAKKILADNNVEMRKKGGQSLNKKYVVKDSKQEKYLPINGEHYIAKYKTTDYQTNDYMNAGGHLTSYIKECEGIEIPTLYDRTEYYKETGNYWWEIYFDIISVKDNKVKHCPFCTWTTNDLENKSGALVNHLLKVHNMSPEEYLKVCPGDYDYLSKTAKLLKKEEDYKDDRNYVICPLCNEKFTSITNYHLNSKHNLSLKRFKELYPNVPITSENMYEKILKSQALANLHVGKNHFISHYEMEIRNFLDKFNVKYETNRQILIGKEIDILVPDKKIGIEFNGLKFHSEFFGHKTHHYHLDKTILCNKKGYNLIHIFEDEYVNHKEIVYSKIAHLLNLDIAKPKIPGRKTIVKKILSNDAKLFLEKYHIQGFSSSTIYLGGFFNDELIAVMSFKKRGTSFNSWELSRFATNDKYIYQGVGGKLFKYFLRNYAPYTIISFADRRWTMVGKPNLYENLGFVLDKVTPPDYRYYNEKVVKYGRLHKMGFTKQSLSKKYGFPLTMTELEMTRELGYDRIWDCGLFRYVYYNGNKCKS